MELDGGTQKLNDISLNPWMTVQNPKLHECNRPPWPTPPPESFTFQTDDGTTLHCAVFIPHTASGERKGPFPAVLSVYAVPHVQMVKNQRRQTHASPMSRKRASYSSPAQAMKSKRPSSRAASRPRPSGKEPVPSSPIPDNSNNSPSLPTPKKSDFASVRVAIIGVGPACLATGTCLG